MKFLHFVAKSGPEESTALQRVLDVFRCFELGLFPK